MKSSKKATILVFRSAALGDFILAVPALTAMRECFPEHQIVLLTTTSGDSNQRIKVESYIGSSPDFQRDLPWTCLVTPHLLDETVVVNDLASWHGLHIARSALKDFRIDFAVMLVDPGAPWGGRFKKWLMLKLVAGLTIPVLGWRGCGSLNGDRQRLKEYGVLRHHVHGPMQFLAEIKPSRSYSDADIRFDLRPGEDVDNFVKEWIANNIPANHRIVAVAPGSVQPHKRWPEIKFKELVSLIISSYSSLDLVLIGTDKDFHLCESIKNLCPSRIHNLAGVFSIPKSASLLSKVQLLVGNDGGAMHLGDSMKCKVVSIVPGIQYPDSIEPWHNKALAVRHPVECSPCYNFTFCPQGHNRCMTDLPVEKVFNKCITILEEG